MSKISPSLVIHRVISCVKFGFININTQLDSREQLYRYEGIIAERIVVVVCSPIGESIGGRIAQIGA